MELAIEPINPCDTRIQFKSWKIEHLQGYERNILRAIRFVETFKEVHYLDRRRVPPI